jgi:integrase
MRGDGYLFQRNGIWWACLWRDGRRIRESLNTTDQKVAEKRLISLRRAKEKGSYLAPAERRVDVNELLDDLLRHLRLKGASSADHVQSHLRAVRNELGYMRATDIDTATIQKVQAFWKLKGFAPATINRRCESLLQAFRLAARHTPPKVRLVPHMPMLKVNNARQGFFGQADFMSLIHHIVNPDVVDFLEWFWWTAMRPKEIRQMTWSMIDLREWVLYLDPRAAKTRKGRVIALEGPLREIIERRLAKRRLDTPLVFHRVSRGRPGQPIRKYHVQWRHAVKAAGLTPGLIPYDLRRSAIRNMLRAGAIEAVIMKISGHRTRATFDRYNIVNEEDTRQAIIRTVDFMARQSTRK